MPFGSKFGGTARPVLVWIVHILAVIIFLVLLLILNRVLGLSKYIPSRFPILQHTWLPLLGLLVYLLGWNIYWLFFIPAEPTRRFPEIDEAWDEALQTLNRIRIDLTDRPLFLILGHPEAKEENLFEAADMDLVVPKTPDRTDAWLHVYANRDENPDNQAIYVTCSKVSLMGKLATRMALEDMTEWERRDGNASSGKTLGPGELGAMRVMRDLHSNRENQGNAKPKTALYNRNLRRYVDEPIPDLRQEQTIIKEYSDRLSYLCERIVADRSPFCGINGILILLPLVASDTEDDASQAAECMKQDLQTVRESIGVCCPVFVLLTDLETTWGFTEYVCQRAPEERLERIGQRFPLKTDLDPEALAKQIGDSVSWMCTQRLREDWVRDFFKVESQSGDDVEELTQRNARLFRLLTKVFLVIFMLVINLR